MKHYYKTTKHPKDGKLQKAAWLDMGKFYYVAFPDGRWYHEKYSQWEWQEELEAVTPQPHKALVADAILAADGE